MRKAITLFAVIITSIICMTNARAAEPYGLTRTATLSIQARIIPSIHVSINENLINFGRIPLTAGSTKAGTGSITVNASNGTSYAVNIDAGQNNTSHTRRMIYTQPGKTVYADYSFFKDPSHLARWGDGNNPFIGNPAWAVGNGADQLFTVYGLITNAPDWGSFSDTVNVTISY